MSSISTASPTPLISTSILEPEKQDTHVANEDHGVVSNIDRLGSAAIESSAMSDQTNDDVVHSNVRDFTYFNTDFWGAIRQGAVIFTSIAELLGKAVTPFVPLGMLITYFVIGSANTYATTYWTKPDAKMALEIVIEVHSILQRLSTLDLLQAKKDAKNDIAALEKQLSDLERTSGTKEEKERIKQALEKARADYSTLQRLSALNLSQAKKDAKNDIAALQKQLSDLERTSGTKEEKESIKKALEKAMLLEKVLEGYGVLKEQLPEEELSDKIKVAKEDAQKASQTAQLNVENHKWYNRMGKGQNLLSVESGVSWGLAHKGISFGGLKLIEAVSSIAFGIILLFRGKALMKRGVGNYQTAHNFRNRFKTAENPIEFMKEAEKLDQVGPGYLMRRVNSACLEHIDKSGNTWKCMANGMQLVKEKEKDKEIANGRFVDLTNNKSYQVEYLKRVDKAMYTEELKHYLTLIIAWSMLIGGITTIIAASILTGGIPLYITIASALFFVMMETFFLTYDSGLLFNMLRDGCYNSDWLKQVLGENAFKERVDLDTWINEIYDEDSGKSLKTTSIQTFAVTKWSDNWKKNSKYREAQKEDRLVHVSVYAAKFFDRLDEIWAQFYASLLQNGREMTQIFR